MDEISTEQRQLDLIKQQLTDAGTALTTSINWLIETAKAEGVLEDIHQIKTTLFDELLEKYKEALANLKAQPVDLIEFNSWLLSLELIDIKHGNLYRQQFLEDAYNTVSGKKTGWLQVVEVLLSDPKYLDPEFWVNTNKEKVRKFLQEDFLDLVVAYPIQNKKGLYRFEDGTIAVRGKAVLASDTFFCRNRSDSFWEVWHKKN